MSENIFYSQLIRPTSMRSQYWKYFGFPANHTGSILSRKKIICTICNTSIAYNKNTTNLKAHLQARHEEQLLTLDQTPSKKIKLIYSPDLEGLKKKTKYEGSGASPKYLYENSSCFDEELSDMEQRYIEPDGKLTSSRTNDKTEHLDLTNSQVFEIAESPPSVDEVFTEDQNDNKKIFLIDNDINQHISTEPTSADGDKDQPEELIYRSDSPVDDIISCSSIVYEDTEEVLLQFFVESGMPAKIVEGNAFKKFCSLLNGNFQVPTAASIEQEICRHFHRDRSAAHSTLLWNLRNNCYYAVGFDMWTNFNNKSFITISIYHNVDSGPAGTIHCENIQTLDTSVPIEWATIFCEFILQSCTAAILNFSSKEFESAHEFLKTNDIPILYCYGYVLKRAVERCFSLPIVKDCLKDAVELLQRYIDDEEHPQPPVVHESFWLTKHQLLEFFIDYCERQSLLNDIELAELNAKIKSLVKSIQTLKMALDTISREKISLVWPVTNKMIEKHFTCMESDSVIEMEIKMAMQNEFLTSLTPESFYLVGSILDPRFQNLTKPENIVNTKAEIRRMCMATTNDDSDLADLITPIKSVRRANVKTTILSSDLSYFFGDNECLLKRNPSRCRLDIEIDNYLTDVDAMLGMCPFEWWQSADGSFYPNLRQLALRYRCVPPTMTVYQLPLSEQIFQHNRRFMLNGNVSHISRMVWLASRNLISS